MKNEVDKLIVTNGLALRAKYGTRVAAVKKAVKALIAADKKRGLKTVLVELDDAATMKKLGAPPVTKALDAKQNKQAIDAVFRAHLPDYLMLLGGIDVIPHQDLTNPAFHPGDDDDRYAYGDVPYACDHPYSKKPEAFSAPTRVVGRLPDLTGAKDPAYLIDVLSKAAAAKSRQPSDYAAHLGVSAAVWKGSTDLSLRKLFGGHAKALLSPSSGPKWPAKQLESLAHFFNCHGSPADTRFYGQRGQAFPVAHDAAWLSGRIAEGTVLSAECCYGAELFDPALTGGQPGICNTYLSAGAYAVFGSSTIAYGPAEGNGSADLLCQFFLKHVLEGASTGRAALEARQDFARSAATLDPYDLKTLAQFSLMGDPSIRPVQTARGYDTPENASTKALPATETDKAARTLRRSRLALAGSALAASVVHVDSASAKATPAAVKKTLVRLARDAGVEPQRFVSFDVKRPNPSRAGRGTAKSAPLEAKRSIHIAVQLLPPPPHERLKRIVAIVATEWDGERVVRKLQSR